jgi:hypothetical protein
MPDLSESRLVSRRPTETKAGAPTLFGFVGTGGFLPDPLDAANGDQPTTGPDGGAKNLKSECKAICVSLRDSPHNACPAHRLGDNNMVNNLLMASHKFRLLAIKATIGPRLPHSKKRQTKQSKAREEGPLGSWSGYAE